MHVNEDQVTQGSGRLGGARLRRVAGRGKNRQVNIG